jgi:hypothetical protein
VPRERILNCLSLSEIAAFFAERERREGEAHQCAARAASGSMAPLFSRNM